MMKKTTLVVLLAAVALAAGCTKQPAPARTATSAPALETVTVSAQNVAATALRDGVVEAVDQAVLSAQTGGRIAELLVDVHDTVKAGDVLVRITDVEQQAAQRNASAMHAAARAAADEAKADLNRTEQIYARQLVARAALDQARARADSTRASLDAAAASVRSAREQVSYTRVLAPWDGVVAQRRVHQGETVGPGQPLIGLFRPGQMRVHVHVPQSDAEGIRAHPHAELVLDDGERIPAASVTVFPYADPQTHSYTVRLELADTDVLTPGQTVKVAFAGGDSTRLLVPANALLGHSEIHAVYVVDEANVRLRQLRLGRVDGDMVEVLAGLREGEQVAADPVAAGVYLATKRQETK